MKLDRNTNRGGRGKYALVNMRKLIPIIEQMEAWDASQDPNRNRQPGPTECNIAMCFEVLVEEGIITLGNETPGDQFFVMKYKDKFTAAGLHAYAEAVRRASLFSLSTAESDSLMEYANEMFSQASAARELGNRIPD